MQKFARRDLIWVKFDEAIDPTSAEDVVHYQIDPGSVHPVSATQETETTVLLDFQEFFLSDMIVNLEVRNVSDVSGNVMTEPEIRLFAVYDSGNFHY